MPLSIAIFGHSHSFEMALVIKSYDPVQHQQRAQRRQQKQSTKRSTLTPRSATCVDSPLSPTSATGLRRSQADHRLIPPNSTHRTQDPYYDYPSSEEVLELCSRKDANISNAYVPASENLRSYSGQDNLSSRYGKTLLTSHRLCYQNARQLLEL